MLRSDFLYTPYYCEENIWQLCGESKFVKKSWVIFISNLSRTCAIWQQKLAGVNSPVVWDYHVILLNQDEAGAFHVFDFDSRLDFGCDAKTYFLGSFPEYDISMEFKAVFKVETAKIFRSNFLSNRDHMKDKNGAFMQPPPPWEKISETSNLETYLDLNCKTDCILNIDEIRRQSWSSLLKKTYS